MRPCGYTPFTRQDKPRSSKTVSPTLISLIGLYNLPLSKTGIGVSFASALPAPASAINITLHSSGRCSAAFMVSISCSRPNISRVGFCMGCVYFPRYGHVLRSTSDINTSSFLRINNSIDIAYHKQKEIASVSSKNF